MTTIDEHLLKIFYSFHVPEYVSHALNLIESSSYKGFVCEIAVNLL
jgi:hypothetical protein